MILLVAVLSNILKFTRRVGLIIQNLVVTTCRYTNMNNVNEIPLSANTVCVCVFCVDLRTNSDYFPIQH